MRTFTVSGRRVTVTEHEGGWHVAADDREAWHRYLDRALAKALGLPSTTATELAAEMLRRPEGGPLF